MAFNPTPLQKAAIEAKGNVLVSAAAGSGKTAVLTERVASHIADEKNPMSADRILVVTFTKAAAAEMRSRIEAKLTERLEQNPTNLHLTRQMLLFPSAKICTIDSFCIDLVRENFDKLGVSPDFKIVEDNVLTAIRNEAISEVFEEQFSKNDKTFLKLLEVVGSRYDDSTLAGYVKRIQEFTSKLPNPSFWLKNAAKQCDSDGLLKWRDLAFELAEKELNAIVEKSQKALEFLAPYPDFSDTFEPLFAEPKIYAEKFLDDVAAKDWNSLYYGVSAATFSRMSSKKIPSECSEISIGKNLRKECVEKIRKLNDLFFDLWENIETNGKMLSPLYEKLAELVVSYNERINEKLNERNILTFYRTEQLAFELLCDFKDGELLINDFAKDYVNNFDEVLVDEYQDTNPLQDMLFCVLSGNEEKLFLVGDVKQSIYGFRGANPSNFLDKKKRYLPFKNQDAAVAKKIILGSNFRSRKEICEFINFFFSIFMTEENGEIDYGEEERLYPEAKYPDAVLNPVEVAFVKNDDEDNLVAEANFIADSIIEIMNSGECIRDERDSGVLRKARFSDFSVLLRATTKAAPIYAAQFEKRGIPVSLGSDIFLKSREVQFVISILDVVDNPTREVSLLAVLLSGFFEFTYDDLALIKSKDKFKNLYSALLISEKSGDEKSKRFLNLLKKYRLKFTTMKISDFLNFIYEDLNLICSFACLDNGERRRQNLLSILNFAKTYEENEGKGVTGFIKFLENVDESTLKISESEENTVKIISIHHSKGLQFPVCYFSACNERFNTKDLSAALLMDEEMYFSFKFFDKGNRRKLTTVQRQILIQKMRQKQLEEELRLAYVAMTRAQDKLVLILSDNNPNETIFETVRKLDANNGKIGKEDFAFAASYGDWILPAVLSHGSSNEIRLLLGAKQLNDDFGCSFELKLIDSKGASKLLGEDDQAGSTVYSAEMISSLSQKINNNLSFVYPFDELLAIESKASVSQLAHSAENDAFAFKTVPSFMSKDGISATQRGTYTHRVMQFLDFKKARKNLEEELQRLYEWQFFSEEDINAVDRDGVCKFLNSNLCERIIKSNFVKKEMRFLTEKPATQINENLDSKFSNENIVIQGAVDCLFEEDGGIVIVDFKTDRVDDEKVLAATYKKQLEIYAGACEKILSKPVKELLLYSFNLGKEIKL